MYVVKVGEYYVRKHEVIHKEHNGMYVGELTLSKEIMRYYSKEFAEYLSKKVNGEVIEIGEEVIND